MTEAFPSPYCPCPLLHAIQAPLKALMPLPPRCHSFTFSASFDVFNYERGVAAVAEGGGGGEIIPREAQTNAARAIRHNANTANVACA